eukprot:scaffold12.g8279.t1
MALASSTSFRHLGLQRCIFAMEQWAVMVAWAIAALLLLRLVIGVLVERAYRRRGNVKTMIVLGSGGHTAEMIALLRGFNLSVYQPRCYVVAATDAMSGSKAAAFEAEVRVAEAEAGRVAAAGLAADGSASTSQAAQQPLRRSPRKAAQAQAAATQERPAPPARKAPAAGAAGRRGPGAVGALHKQAGAAAAQYSSSTIPRSREVGQPWLSSARSTAYSLWFAAALVFRQRPDLLLVNGPGTCVPIVAAAWLARLLGAARGRVAYVESIARVYRLSLTGPLGTLPSCQSPLRNSAQRSVKSRSGQRIGFRRTPRHPHRHPRAVMEEAEPGRTAAAGDAGPSGAAKQHHTTEEPHRQQEVALCRLGLRPQQEQHQGRSSGEDADPTAAPAPAAAPGRPQPPPAAPEQRADAYMSDSDSSDGELDAEPTPDVPSMVHAPSVESLGPGSPRAAGRPAAEGGAQGPDAGAAAAATAAPAAGGAAPPPPVATEAAADAPAFPAGTEPDDDRQAVEPDAEQLSSRLGTLKRDRSPSCSAGVTNNCTDGRSDKRQRLGTSGSPPTSHEPRQALALHTQQQEPVPAGAGGSEPMQVDAAPGSPRHPSSRDGSGQGNRASGGNGSGSGEGSNLPQPTAGGANVTTAAGARRKRRSASRASDGKSSGDRSSGNISGGQVDSGYHPCFGGAAQAQAQAQAQQQEAAAVAFAAAQQAVMAVHQQHQEHRLRGAAALASLHQQAAAQQEAVAVTAQDEAARGDVAAAKAQVAPDAEQRLQAQQEQRDRPGQGRPSEAPPAPFEPMRPPPPRPPAAQQRAPPSAAAPPPVAGLPGMGAASPAALPLVMPWLPLPAPPPAALPAQLAQAGAAAAPASTQAKLLHMHAFYWGAKERFVGQLHQIMASVAAIQQQQGQQLGQQAGQQQAQHTVPAAAPRPAVVDAGAVVRACNKAMQLIAAFAAPEPPPLLPQQLQAQLAAAAAATAGAAAHAMPLLPLVSLPMMAAQPASPAPVCLGGGGQPLHLQLPAAPQTTSSAGLPSAMSGGMPALPPFLIPQLPLVGFLPGLPGVPSPTGPLLVQPCATGAAP